jgi:hypothetical protein
MTLTVTLPAAISFALDEVRIEPGGMAGGVGDHPIQAASRREFRARLANAIYCRWHLRTGTVFDEHHEPRRDLALEEELRAAVPHEFTLARARLLGTDEARPDQLLIERAGVRTWVPASAAGTPGPLRAGLTVELRVTPVRPRLSPGFFLVDGSRGLAPEDHVRRVYLHVRDAADALATWREALEALERDGARYRAKVIATWQLPERADGMTIYLPHDDLATISSLARINRGIHQRKTSIFAEAIGHGIAIADEPADSRPGMGDLSFGEHRAHVVAHALVRHAVSHAGAGRIDIAVAVATALRNAGIDPLNPARNGDRH